MNYTEHKDNPKSFRALTGLTHIQYSHLLPYFEAAHDDYLSDYEMNGKRRTNRRSFCIYKNSPLPDVRGEKRSVSICGRSEKKSDRFGFQSVMIE